MNKRQKELAQLSLDAEKEVLDKLEKEYNRALKDINEKVKVFAHDIEQIENAIDTAEDDRQKEILISQRQSKVYQKKYQEALQGQISGILDKMQGDEYATIEEYLKECYEDAYIGTLYDLQGQGIPLIMPIDQAAAVKAIMTDSKISKGLYTALGVDIAKLKKTISSEITRGIASSRPYAEIARNLGNAAEIPKNRAKLITRTEGHRVQSASNYNACVDAKAKGADVVKQWSAALDARTRPSHRSLDGQIVEVDEPFSLGNKTAMFPGDFGDPAEDCNCRCRVNQRARWALDSMQTKMLGNTDKMTDEDLKPIADKLHISTDELRKYSNQIIPVKADSYEDFKRQYNQIWNYDNRENYTGGSTKGFGAKIGDGDLVSMHEAPKYVKKVDFADKKAIVSDLAEFEKTAVKSKIELARVVTKDGNVYDCYGTKDRIFPDYDLKNNLIGAIMTHSHPIEETQHTFSNNDAEMFMEYELEILRGCDEKYTYEFTRDTNNLDELPEKDADDLTPELFWHYMMIKTALEYGIGYRRWENDER